MSSIPQPPELIGESPLFLDALAHASSAAALDRPLLVVGERGSGKELIAGRIHFLSPRWEAPFVKVNCAALTDELLESELFGHEAGAFTGAQKRHTGRFERAEGGTLFLDEIASASSRVQEKLLRVIEYGEYERVGGEATLIADVRVVAAANVDLPAQTARGGFRADLLDRLAFDVIHAPPLRARREDIPLLAAHFASGMAREMGETFEGFTPAAMTGFRNHDWPGNVRELKNAAERSVYRWITNGRDGPVDEILINPFDTDTPIASAPADADDTSTDPVLPSRLDISPAPIDLRERLDELEKLAVEEALMKTNANQTLAAKALGLSYDQIRGLVRKHRINPKQLKSAAAG